MATEFINRHMTRVLARGATNIDMTWLEAIDAWIASESLQQNLLEWANPACGVIKDGSDKIATVFGLGSTWLSRLGDLVPKTQANCTYEATGMSSKPCWSNSNAADLLYWGTTARGTIRLDQIRRKQLQGLTIVSVCKHSGTFGMPILGLGQGNRLWLQISADPGKLTFTVGNGGESVSDQHPTTLLANATNIVGGTFDGDEAIAYVEGVAGAGDSGYIAAATDAQYSQFRPLMGSNNGRNAQQQYSLGIHQKEVINSHNVKSVTRSVTGTSGNANHRMAEIIIFDTCLTPTQMASLNTLLRTRY